MRPFKHAVGTSSWNVAIVYAVVSYFLLAWPWSTPGNDGLFLTQTMSTSLFN